VHSDWLQRDVYLAGTVAFAALDQHYALFGTLDMKYQVAVMAEKCRWVVDEILSMA
jgi:hypothetical protein